MWIVLAIVVGIAASKRRRSAVGWFCVAILISPVLALLLLIAFPMRRRVALYDDAALRRNIRR